MSPGIAHARCRKEQEPSCLAQLDTAHLSLCHTETDTSGKLINRHFTNVLFAILNNSLALTRNASLLSVSQLHTSANKRHPFSFLSASTSYNLIPSKECKQICTGLNLTILCSRRTKTVRAATAYINTELRRFGQLQPYTNTEIRRFGQLRPCTNTEIGGLGQLQPCTNTEIGGLGQLQPCTNTELRCPNSYSRVQIQK